MRFSLLGISLLASLVLACPSGQAAPLVLESTLEGASGETIHLIAGELPEGLEEGGDAVLGEWLVSRLGRDRAGELPYLEVVGVEFSEGRSPQALGLSKVSALARRWGERFHASVVRPVQRLQAGAASWVSKPENKSRLGFALLATSLDGTLNTGAMVILQGTPLPEAMAVGATVAALSGAWTFATPQVARFLAGAPSLVDRILGKRESIARQGGKMFEGLIKWGLIEFAVLSVISGVSLSMGTTSFVSVSSWALSNVGSALLATSASGTFDFSLSYELDRMLQDPSLSVSEKRRFLVKNQIIGVTVGTLGTLGGVAKMMGQDFGSFLLYGLTALGVANLARVEWKEVQRLQAALSHKCGAHLLGRRSIYREFYVRNPDYPNYGSE